MELTYSLEDISSAAEMVLKALQGSRVIAFNGEMGAGKTTFIQALCRHLGVTENMSSPTFSIINEYSSTDGPVYHIDLYRCSSDEEAVRAGVEECLYSKYTCLVEWPSRAERLFPGDTKLLSIEEVDKNTRKITINSI